MSNSVADAPCCPARMLYAAAVVSAVLLYASFFPLNFGFLGWGALVPLFFLIRSNQRPRHIYWAAYLGGLIFYVAAIQWMRVAHAAMYGTWVGLSIYSALYFPLAIWLIRKLDRAKIPLALVVPSVWVGLEYMRMHFPTGFPWLEGTALLHRIGFGWYFMGYSQHEVLPLIQIADLASVYGVSLLVVLVNTVIYLWLSRNVAGAVAAAPRPWLSTAAAAVLIASAVTYGFNRLDHPPFEEGPRVAMLQSNLPQSVKMGDDHMVDLHMRELLAQAHALSPDLIVWPETTCTVDWHDAVPDADWKSIPSIWLRAMADSKKFADRMQGWNTNQLLGLHGMEIDASGQVWKYNSAKMIYRDGEPGPRYDKMHLVPFGEYVPMRNTFPWLKALTPYRGDYSCKPGEHWTRFPLKVKNRDYFFGCIICYEDTDSSLARQYVHDSPEGPAVDFLVNISNDGWFNGTEEHEQHLAICRFRAVECRRSVVRAVNMGISGIIDGDGRVVLIPGDSWSSSKKVATVVNGPVPLDHRESLYARWGDWLPLGCWALMVGGLLVGRWRRRGVQA